MQLLLPLASSRFSASNPPPPRTAPAATPILLGHELELDLKAFRTSCPRSSDAALLVPTRAGDL